MSYKSRILLQGRIRSISQRSATTVDADRDTTDQVAASDGETSPEQCEAGVVGLRIENGSLVDVSDLGGEDDGHDDSVDGDDLAEDDGDQVLGSDPRRLDTGTENRRTGDEYTPGGC